MNGVWDTVNDLAYVLGGALLYTVAFQAIRIHAAEARETRQALTNWRCEHFSRRRDFGSLPLGRNAHAGKDLAMPYRDPEKRRKAAREATRRWYQRNKEILGPARRQRDRERYAAERESVLAAKRERYANDPLFAERVRLANRDWYERHRGARRESQQRNYVENAEHLRAQGRVRNRQRYAKNPRAALDYYKQWRLRNLQRARAYVRVSNHKRRATAAGGHFTFEEWEALLAEHQGHCAYCGSTERIEADHRMPLCRGGSNLIANILPACRHCNRRKHQRTEEEFRAVLQNERRATLVAD